MPGLTANRARQGGADGQAKSNPKDGRIIAGQFRLCPDDFRRVALQDAALTEAAHPAPHRRASGTPQLPNALDQRITLR